MSVLWETATIVKNGVTYWLKDEKARALIKECYSPSNPPPSSGGAVESVNGKIGAVELDAHDVGALPDTTPIPSKTSDLTNDSGFITAAAVPTKTSDLTNDSGFITAAAVPSASNATPQDLGTAAPGSSANYSRADHVHQKPTYSKTDVGLGNVDNVQQYSASNPPPYPVRTVNGQTGDVVVQGGGSGIAISDTQPTGDELVWIDTDDDGSVHQVLELSDFDSADGHCKMPDGTLIQWGSITVQQGSTAQYVGQTYQMGVSISLPIPFVDTNYRVFGSSKFVSGGAIAIGHDVSQSTASSAYIRAWDYTPRTLSSSETLKIWWIAIGRWR